MNEDFRATSIYGEKSYEVCVIDETIMNTVFPGHIAQLTQSISQLSLKPGEEEIKKKGWWQFWK